jgi:hypothetical protein
VEWLWCRIDRQTEKLQLEAARIVTGLPAYLSRDSLYLETEWGKFWIDEIGDITEHHLIRKYIFHDMSNKCMINFI